MQICETCLAVRYCRSPQAAINRPLESRSFMVSPPFHWPFRVSGDGNSRCSLPVKNASQGSIRDGPTSCCGDGANRCCLLRPLLSYLVFAPQVTCQRAKESPAVRCLATRVTSKVQPTSIRTKTASRTSIRAK